MQSKLHCCAIIFFAGKQRKPKFEPIFPNSEAIFDFFREIPTNK